MEEEWRVIEDYPDYAVSNIGRVKRIDRGRHTWIGKILKPSISNRGYGRITLHDNGNRKRISVHRLVLTAFRGSCPSNHECNHKDGNKANNNLKNLEWVTKKQNQRHAVENGLLKHSYGEKHGRSKLKNKEVWLIKRLLANKIKQRIIGRMFKVSHGCISKISDGEHWKHIKI